MRLKNLLMKGTAKLADLTFDKNLSSTRDKAREDGYHVTFEGEYRQAPEGQPDAQIRVPFVVAQSEKQRDKLSKGVLEGRIYDARRFAVVNGAIDESSVRFGKLYDESSIENPEQAREGIEMIQGILGAVGVHSTVKYDHLVNPHVITYEGERTDKADELSYFGRWNFNSDNADMEQEGPFEMKVIDPQAMKEIL